MKIQNKRLLLLRILLGALIVANMFMILWFSSHNGDMSSMVSNKFATNFVALLPKNFVDKIVNGTDKTETTVPALPEATQPSSPTEPPTTDVGETEPTPPEGTEPEPTPPQETEPEPTPPQETEPEVTPPAETEPTPPDEVEPEPEDKDAIHKQNQAALVQKWYLPVRKVAHMIEFGSLGILVLLFLLTWHGKIWWRYLVSIVFAFIYALCDEWSQLSRAGRDASMTDVLFDITGAFIACTLLLTLVIVIKSQKKLITTYYKLPIKPNGKPLRIGLVTDLHACAHQDLVLRLRAEKPDVILLAGDLMEGRELEKPKASGHTFLRACAKIAPTFYSLGNHETIGADKKELFCEGEGFQKIRKRINEAGVTLLHNESVLWNGIRICGLTSGLSKQSNRPDEKILSEFAAAKEFRILLCHHPEYYEPYIRPTDIDLTVSGHAHGGQWRLFGHGVFAPGQGIFPKYTAGVVDNRLVISRGAGDHTVIPRISNPRELVIIYCE